MEPPRPATAAPTTDLVELLQGVRRELGRREEAPTGEWVESSAADLHSGAQPGWYYPPSEDGGGVGFARIRDRRLWGHVHSGGGPPRVERAYELAARLLPTPTDPADVATIGFTGLTEAEEREVVERLSRRPGSTVIERFAMERDLLPEDETRLPEPPTGLRRVGVRDVTADALADLDWRSFRGTVDDLMIGGSADEYRRMISGLLSNSIGRFLDEASTVLVDEAATRLVGGVFTSEVSPRQALFLDLMVDPSERRRGIGRFLMGWAFRALRSLGYQRTRLWVTVANVNAVQLYESEGFVRVAATTIYRWDRGDPSPQPHSAR